MSDPQPLAYESSQTDWTGVGIGTIGLQLVGVYCVVLALPAVSLLASAAGFSALSIRGGQLLYSFIPLFAYIVMGVLLIRFAPRLSLWLFGHSAGGVMSGPVTLPVGQYLQAVAFSVAGVLTMVNVAPRLISNAVFLWMETGVPFRWRLEMIEPVVQFVLGLVLFLQSRGLSMLWHRLRRGEGSSAAGPASVSPPIPGDSQKA